MSLNDDKFILGCKTRKEILNDFENRFVEIVFGYAFILVAFVLLILSSNSELDKLYVLLILTSIVIIGMVLLFLGRRCPFCDSMKSVEYYEIMGFSAVKGSFRCNNCNFSSNQIKEVIDMLKRGVEINAEVIAKFNRRDI
jgi:hypothetical protein